MDWGEFFLPTTDKRAQEAQIEGQKIINESAGIKLRQQKEADEINKIAGQATPHISRAITLAKTGDIAGATTAINKAYGYIPNGGKFELVDSPSGKQFRLTGLDGSSSTMPATNQSLSENIAELSNMLDPNNRVQTWMKARMETEDFNKKQMQTPQRDGKGNIFYTQFKDGRMVAVDESGKELATIPQDIAYVEGRKKFKADTDKTVSETAENYSSVKENNANAGRIQQATKDAKTSAASPIGEAQPGTILYDKKTGKVIEQLPGKQKEEEYPGATTDKVLDGLWKTHGIRVGQTDDDGNPITVDAETQQAAQQKLYEQGYTGKWKIVGDEVVFTGVEKGTQNVVFKGKENGKPAAPQAVSRRKPPRGFKADPEGRTVNGKPVYVSADGKKAWY